MNAVLGGFMAGYSMAILSTFALTFLATRARAESFVQRFFAAEVPGALLAVPIFIGAQLGWTMLGLVFGSIYEVGGFDAKPGALGAPSWAFLMLMGTIAWLPLPPLVLFGRQYWWLWLTMSLAFTGLFGWFMPVVAER